MAVDVDARVVRTRHDPPRLKFPDGGSWVNMTPEILCVLRILKFSAPNRTASQRCVHAGFAGASQSRDFCSVACLSSCGTAHHSFRGIEVPTCHERERSRRVVPAVGHAVEVVARTGTILFTDLVGSTALRTTLGDEAFDEQRRWHDGLLDEAVVRHRGEVVKHEGDGIMAMFASAADAIACAASMQRALDRESGGAVARFEMRVGVSAGDVADEDGDYHGIPVVEAARLCAAARGGQILVADVVRVLAGSRNAHDLMSVGALELKGLVEPLVAWQVSWVIDRSATAMPARLGEIAGRGACVGRERELTQLEAVWKRTTEGVRQLALIAGEPGIGKTRLAAALAASTGERAVILHGWWDEDFGVA
jgi:class 3 adenylate cyclase